MEDMPADESAPSSFQGGYTLLSVSLKVHLPWAPGAGAEHEEQNALSRLKGIPEVVGRQFQSTQ